MIYSIQDKIIYGSFAVCITVILHAISFFYYKQKSNLKDSDKKRIVVELFLLMTIIMVVFCAFRSVREGYGGTDTPAYMEQFAKSNVPFSKQIVQFVGWEPLHYTSLWVVRHFTSDFRVYLCLYNALFSLLLMKYATMFRLSRYHLLSTFAIVLFMLTSFNTQRNTFAAFFALFVVDAIIRSEYVKAIVLTLITMGIHVSSGVLFFPIAAFLFVKYVYGHIKVKYFAYSIGALCAAVLLGNTIQLIIGGSRLSAYSKTGSIAYGIAGAFLLILVVFEMYYKQIMHNDKLFKLSLVYLAFAPAFIFQMYYAIAYRLLLYSIPIMYAIIGEYKQFLCSQKSEVIKRLSCLALDMVLLYRIVAFFWGNFSDVGSYSNILFN